MTRQFKYCLTRQSEVITIELTKMRCLPNLSCEVWAESEPQPISETYVGMFEDFIDEERTYCMPLKRQITVRDVLIGNILPV